MHAIKLFKLACESSLANIAVVVKLYTYIMKTIICVHIYNYTEEHLLYTGGFEATPSKILKLLLSTFSYLGLPGHNKYALLSLSCYQISDFPVYCRHCPTLYSPQFLCLESYVDRFVQVILR